MYNYDGTWTTEEGITAKLTDMSDGHLKNIIKYLERNAKEIAFRDKLNMVTLADSASEANQDAWGSLDPANELIESHYGISDIGDVYDPGEELDKLNKQGTDLEWLQLYYEPYKVIKAELDKRDLEWDQVEWTLN